MPAKVTVLINCPIFPCIRIFLVYYFDFNEERMEETITYIIHLKKVRLLQRGQAPTDIYKFMM